MTSSMADSDPFKSESELRTTGTESSVANSAPPAAARPPELPDRIGRYRIEKVLGEGGFGLVYLGYDDDLDRPVAIKVPHAGQVSRPEDSEAYRTEARTVARLEHPNIVPVYDVGSTQEFACYVVSKYVAGSDLSAKIQQHGLSSTEAAALIASVAEALHYAHTQGLVHRDIKPANILLDAAGKPFVADFGLALKETDSGRGARYAGTAAYMSPEQARGEGHRVDGRSDIFSLGIVFYQLLVGKRPFDAKSTPELLNLIATVEVRPPRQINDSIPRELERICLKALAKRSTERYTTARDMAEDLRYFLSTATSQMTPAIPAQGSPPPITPAGETQVASDTPAAPRDSYSQPIRIVPKGLRSFDEHDADFFLELLPGPRDREGLPDSLRFWKTRIEETDADNTFSVGLIYGPSGCGKSSLVKAGLLPRLSKDVIAVYVEATPHETETRILRGLRKQLPDLSDDLDLVETFTLLRRNKGQKIVIVLDQFEQWLHAHKTEQETVLVRALRQCDGGNIQSIVMVRDDFWMAASRFAQDLEVKFHGGDNAAVVDLFGEQHAQKILKAFGCAYDRIATKPTGDQSEFIQQAIQGLAEEGKVVSVRIALFADMLKEREWSLVTLHEIGGTEGVGVTFLEGTFSARTAPAEHRLHQHAACKVLKVLLPEVGTNIKGHMRSHEELLESSGYKNRPGEFNELLHILDGELRLITPTEPEGFQTESGSEPGSKYYQLTHDYLVSSLREWLTRKQKENRRGRAELTLAERSALWIAKPENRHLPSLWEWANIRSVTEKNKWTAPQQKMMRRASRLHSLRFAIVAALVLAACVTGVGIHNAVVAERLVDGLLTAETSMVPSIIDELKQYRNWADPDLAQEYGAAENNSTQKLHVAMALLSVDGSKLDYLSEQLLVVTPDQFPTVRDTLKPYKKKLVDRYWETATDIQQTQPRRFQAACALASYDPNDERWNEINKFVASHLVNVLPSELLPWRNALRPVKSRLLVPLGAIYRDDQQRDLARSFATTTLLDYAAAAPDELFNLLADADQIQFLTVYGMLLEHRLRAVELAHAELAKTSAADASEDDKEYLAQRQANAAVALFKLGETDEVWPLLQYSPDPRVRSYIIHRLSPLRGDPQAIIARFQEEPDVTIKRALLLSLGEFDESQLGDSERNNLIKTLLSVYRSDADSGLHAAAEWLLRRWNQSEQIAEVDTDPQLRAAQDNQRQWYINTQGQTFVVLQADEFLMGSPESEPKRRSDEILHRRRIGRRFAISAKEVTKSQYRAFQRDNPHIPTPNIEKYSPTDDSPQVGVDWYDAAAYCNWLSEKDGILEDQWCYEPDEKGVYGPGMKAKGNFLELSGYRLPTEAEWEFACRARTVTSRYYGLSDSLLPKYGRFLANAQTRTWPVGRLKPNGFGLFDMQGNVIEWCHNKYVDYDTIENDVVDDIPDVEPVTNKFNRVLRGGSFYGRFASLRSPKRSDYVPTNRSDSVGFRPSRTYNLSP